MNETWKSVQGFPDYEVSNLGRVRSWRIKGNTTKSVLSPRILKQNVCGSNQKYLAVKLYRNNKGHPQRVHRLVLEAFIGPMPVGEECRHLNGNSMDNSLTNLAYGTHQQNMDDQKSHGTGINPFGESHGMSILTETDVLAIRASYAEGGITQRELAEKYNVDPSTISLIIRRKKWTHI